MPQPVAFNTGSSISGSIQASRISYAIETSGSNYRGGYAGKTWYSELPATTGVVFIKDTTAIGRGNPGNPAFWITNGTSSANILTTVNGLPGSPRNFTTTQSAYSWSLANGFFINDPNEPFNQIDTDSLALYLDASKTVSYPTTASTWYDISGNNLSGSLVNSPTFNSNGYINFDGADDYIRVNSNILQDSGGTISMIVYPKSTASSSYIFAAFGTNSDRYYITYGTDGRFVVYRGNPIVGMASPVTTINKWYNIVLTWTSSSLSGYLDGNIITSTPYSASGVTSFFTIGAYTSPLGSQAFNGNIASTQIYSRPLSQTEINQNYYQAPIVTSGLVMALDANNIVSYESGSTIAYSLTGSLSGSLVNGTSYSNNNGGSWVFDGADDYISTSENINPSNITLEFFYKALITSSYEYLISNARDCCGTYKGYELRINNGSPQFQIWNSTNATVYGTSTLLNQIYHVAATYDGSQLKMYQNGVLTGTTNSTLGIGSPPSYNLAVGGMGFGPSQYNLTGNIYVGRVYNRALTQTEIQQNFNAQRNRFNI
jgi:hypothetical protein